MGQTEHGCGVSRPGSNPVIFDSNGVRVRSNAPDGGEARPNPNRETVTDCKPVTIGVWARRDSKGTLHHGIYRQVPATGEIIEVDQ